MHRGALYILGGLSADGFSENTRVSSDGVEWNNTGDAPLAFGARAYFSAASFLGQLWVTLHPAPYTLHHFSSKPRPYPGTQVTGGRASTLGSAMSDVWRSPDGVAWVRAAQSAKWPARAHHVCACTPRPSTLST